ncbi:hypothetical protein EST38_g1887 [Candolleomyces aberdarensis]|uniref:Uncharacterized protein n=1 Tax=Candolleomyces aberdarensis TaxID=2316362 RepID=A0A4Q2DUZ6_9AGAR|nr:hypothetical protein EST38_g1887 [Candolleomyces aberdarensis]
MDIDWCLTCEKHIQEAANFGPYCSLDCRCRAGPSRLIEEYESTYEESLDDFDLDEDVYHDVQDASDVLHYSGNDYDGIAAWAAAVVPGPPVQERSPPPSRRSNSSSRSSISSNYSPKSISTTYRPPDLVKPHRPLPPSLCMTTPKPKVSVPSQPIGTLPPQVVEYTASGVAYSTSTGQTSSIATPASAYAVLPFSVDRKATSVLDTIASHVRSWAPAPSQPHSPSARTQILTGACVSRPRLLPFPFYS